MYQFLVIFLFLSVSIGTALLICYNSRSSPPAPTEVTLTLLHTNDVHSRRKEFGAGFNDCKDEERNAGGCFGGSARQMYMIEKIRAESPHPVLLFDGGDQFQGTYYYNYYKGKVTADVMNRMKYTAMTFGNHEFDDGIGKLQEFVGLVDFPVLCANIDASHYPEFAKSFKPYVIFEEHSLGVIGYITPSTAALSNVALPNVYFLPPAPAVQKVIDELRASGIRRIIAVSHNGYVEDQEVASQTEGLSLIIGGHSHTLLPAPTSESEVGAIGYYPTKVINMAGKPTYVVQASWAGKYLGNLNITWSIETDELTSIQGSPILLDNSVPKHEEMDKFVTERGAPFQTILAEIIGTATATFPAFIEAKDSAIGNLLADAVLDYRPESEFFIITGGCMRSSFRKGAISWGDVLTVLPFNSIIYEKMVPGQFIVDIVENILAKRNLQTNEKIISIPHFRNAKVTYKSNAPEGKRIVSLKIGDRTKNPVVYKTIDVKREYRYSTIDFIAHGGDNVLPQVLDDYNKLDDFAEVVKNYIRKNSRVTPYFGDGMQKVD